MLSTQLAVDRQSLAEVCRKFHVRKLSLFGSAIRGELRPDSDVDLLVEFEPGFLLGLFEFGRLSDQLSAVFEGRQIDLMMPDEVHWFIRDAVLNSAQTIYEG